MARPALALHELPQDATARREVLELRARPSLSKPKLSPEQEARLATIEERSAQCYVHAEEIAYRLHRAAARINDYVPRYVRKPTGV